MHRWILVACIALVGALATAVTARSEEAADGPERVVFGGDASYPPFEWLEDGQPQGFNIELERALAEMGGARSEHRLGDWPDIVRALRSGEIDVVPMFPSPEREQEFVFTAPFYYMHHSIYARRDAYPAYAIQQLAGHRVAVEELSYAHQRLEQENFVAELELVLAPNTLAALDAVENGSAEYAVLAAPAAEALIRRHSLSAQTFGSPIWPREYAFAVRKDRAELARWLQDNYAMIVASGRYDHVYQNWRDQLSGRQRTFTTALRDAMVILLPLGALLLLATAWSWSLRRTVHARTARLDDELQRREQAEEALLRAADYDSNTDLPTLDYFLYQLDRLLERMPQTDTKREVLVLRIADLERVTHTFGYAISNAYVREFADRLRAADYAACGHLGRGVFAIFAMHKPAGNAFNLLARPLTIGGLELHPNLVGGSALYPEHGQSAAKLLRHAETALAVSVARQQQWVRYENSMEPDENDLKIVADFRRTEGRELHALFQPQADLTSGAIIGAELLARWQHPQLGLIPPTRFIPLLESTGLIKRVTHRMLNESIRVANQLFDTGYDCRLSVNVSAHDLIETEFVQVIKRELVQAGCPPSRIKLELTETTVAQDPEAVRRTLQALHELGIAIAVDDFGTGWSSLSYLSTFPISEIKIDREFVDGMLDSARKLSIVKSAVMLAKDLGMRTIAEGAEDAATVDLLREIGCDAVQGYHLSRPLPETEFLRYLAEHAAASPAALKPVQ